MTATWRCPVCGFDGLAGPPFDELGLPSFETCPTCGIQFGSVDSRKDVRHVVYRAWSERWLANGRRPLSPPPTLDDLLGGE